MLPGYGVQVRGSNLGLLYNLKTVCWVVGWAMSYLWSQGPTSYLIKLSGCGLRLLRKKKKLNKTKQICSMGMVTHSREQGT